ncbi:MAG: hypothetical protein A4E30_01020 [Methanomassiliicoccales archaeon PtaB.Bin215]|nr:MAG: hypothetical protein A4E30_01020 [Methanomassiliicoccales archaeon PtaB.Bin215]
MSPWKDKDNLLALMVGIVLITAIVLAAMAFAPLSHFTRGGEWKWDEPTMPETLGVEIDVDVCDVEVTFDDLTEGLVEVRYAVEGRSGVLTGEPDVNFTVIPRLNGENLTVSVVLDMETGPTVTYKESDVTVVIDRSMPTSLIIDVDVGDVVVTVPDNASLTGAAVHTDVGGLHLHLKEGARVGDMDLISDVGSVNVDCLDVVFDEDAVVTAETGTGSIYLDIGRSSSSLGNVTFDCLANVGSVHLTLNVEGDTSAEITSQANVGDIETELVGFSGMDVHLVSDNHPDTWTVELMLEADVGSVHIDAEWRE